MLEFLERKLQIMQFDVVWFVLAFIGIVLAIGSRRSDSVTKWAVVNTFSSGMAFGIALPVLVRDVLGYDSTALLAVAAMGGGFFGMKLMAVVLKFDPQEALTKRLGGGGGSKK